MFYEDIRLEREFVVDRKIATFAEHDLHTHDALEISVVLENEVVYKMEGQKKVVGKPGDVYVFRPFEAHWNLVGDVDKPAEWIMLLFSPSLVRHVPYGFRLLAPFYTMGWNPLIPSGSKDAVSIRSLALRVLKESEEKRAGWETKNWLTMVDILLIIYRHYTAWRQGNAVDDQVGEGIIQAIEQILHSYTGDVAVDELISLSGLKKTWFYRQFTRMTALTPNEFINRLRLQHASQLLTHTNMSVTEIAYESGFHSLGHFHKMFKNYRGMTPREYRLNG